MPVTASKVRTAWTTGLTDVLVTGTWRNSFPYYQQRPSPCHNACPTGGNIPVWIRLLNQGQSYQAWLILVSANPLPAATGRICHHPCEQNCNRDRYDARIAVKALERHLGDLAIQEAWRLPEAITAREESIAVVGSGPAGLSAAYQLRRQGYRVSIFEARPEPGGMLRYGIPAYRLPKAVLQQEIQRLTNLGIVIHTNCKIDRPDALEQLKREHHAVLLATGAGKPKRLPQLQMDLPGVFDGLDFLSRTNQGEKIDLRSQVIVIGGGSSAMDVARSAIRHGSQVIILALETKDTMPAQAEEINQALEEGILLHDSTMVKSVSFNQGRLQLTCVKAIIDQNTPGSLFKPIIIPGSEYNLQADSILLAIGQEPELEWLARLEQNNGLLTIDQNQSTSQPGIFAAGDLASTARYVSEAIGAGKKAAQSIKSYLGLKDLASIPLPETTEVSFEDINTFYFPTAVRVEALTLNPKISVKGFSEVKPSLSPSQALSEANRCFNCGYCIECNTCFYYCPDMAVARTGNKERPYSILDQYCKGCGLCAAECPRGVIVLKEEIK